MYNEYPSHECILAKEEEVLDYHFPRATATVPKFMLTD